MSTRPPDARIVRFWLASLLAAGAALCAARADAAWTTVDAGRGPVALNVPAGVDAQHPAPLAIMIHGFGGSGAVEESYLNLASRFASAGILYATPDGTVDRDGNRFWDATPACCDVYDEHPNDVAYLVALIDAVAAEYAVDRARIYFLGHSNGGFMSYRMACERADLVAGIVSLAGATFLNASSCSPSRPVPALEIHGTADTTIEYDGGVRLAPYPSAPTTFATWGNYNGCSSTVTTAASFDADASVAGAETTIRKRVTGCAGGGAELWSIVGGEHIPDLTSTLRSRLVSWLVAAGEAAPLFADGFESGGTAAWLTVK